MSESDIYEEFKTEIQHYGMAPPQDIVPGKLIRFSDDGRRNKDGWYILFINPDGSAGASFGNWKGVDQKWFRGTNGTSLSKEEKASLYKQIEENKRKSIAERKKQQTLAAEKAMRMWDAANPANPENKYLVRKQVKSYGLKESSEVLLVPVMCENNRIISLQKIKQDGSKTFLKDGRTKGGFFLIGSIEQAEVIYICEGYATGASIFEATQIPTVVAFNSGNLKAVAELYKRKNPAIKIIIAADNDLKTEKEKGFNPGIKSAKEAAKAVNAGLCICPIDSDFNDLFVEQGIESVRAVLLKEQTVNSIQIDEQAIEEQAKKILDGQQPCGTFDISKLPCLISKYAEELCDQTAAEPIMIVQSILCTFSAIIGRKVCIPETEYFQRLYSNIWCCTMSKSGSFKTTALNKGATIASQIQKKIQDEIGLLNSPVNDDDSSIKLSSKKIEAMIKELERRNPILSTRATAEALTEELSTGQSGQIIASELGAWLKNMNASHAGSIKQILTDFFDVPASYTYRTRTGGVLSVHEPFITINGVSTLEWIEKNLEEDDVTSGFFARFLLFYPPQNKIVPSALPQLKKSSSLQPLLNDFTDILESYRSLEKTIECRLNPEAKELFNVYHNSLYSTFYDEPEKTQMILEPFLKRWSPYLLKIAMLMQAIDTPWSNELTPDALVAAKHVVDYAVKSTTFLFKNRLGETDHQRKCRKILEYFARHKGERTWGQLLSSHTLGGGSKDYEYPCQTLEESGKIHVDRLDQNKKKHVFALIREG